MKRILYIFILSVILVSCDETVDPTIYDPATGQTGIGFSSSFQSFTVPAEGVTRSVEVLSSTISSSDRTFATVVNAGTTANPEDYVLGQVTIPANSHVGSLDVMFLSENLEDFVTKTLIVDLSLDDSVFVSGSTSTTFSFTKEFICNDVELTLLLDTYPEETSWEITSQADGSVIASGGPYGDEPDGSTISETIFLEDGCYTFTIFDAFGDGICCNYGNGFYELSCVLTLATGAEFGAEESTNFCINQ
ncbi:hypothetical protein [Winogradskyella sp. 3972H.M.0a.05]|uniref:hypothetical protein n=1 Tax=Winogradskyella sp. 3972H.M.0a.05 TaxID=2950277 RepID=UPI00339A13F0